jgi:hypothetical protein
MNNQNNKGNGNRFMAWLESLGSGPTPSTTPLKQSPTVMTIRPLPDGPTAQRAATNAPPTGSGAKVAPGASGATTTDGNGKGTLIRVSANEPSANGQLTGQLTSLNISTANQNGPQGFFYSEPDSPFQPHQFSPRANLLNKSPRVLISPEAYKHMFLYVEIANKEVGWLGTVSKLPTGDFLIDETFLLEQEVTSTETLLSTEGQNKLVIELMEKGDAGIEQTNRLRFWGHSHVRMGTSPSGTDESTMMRFAGEGMPWYVRGIFNKRGRAEFTVYFYEMGFRICDAPWAVYDPIQKKVILDGSGRSFGNVNQWETRPWQAAVSVAAVVPATVATPANTGSAIKDKAVPPAAPANGTTGNTQPSAGSHSTIGNATATGATETSNDTLRPTQPKAPYAPEPIVLPEILIPSDAMRAQVQAEFDEKVTERTYFSLFGGLFNSDKDGKEGTDGNNPTKDGVQSGKPGGNGAPTKTTGASTTTTGASTTTTGASTTTTGASTTTTTVPARVTGQYAPRKDGSDAPSPYLLATGDGGDEGFPIGPRFGTPKYQEPSLKDWFLSLFK